ncbi:hypothetical protein [Nostoc sp.]|uniref:hypothetical protein n=1 Tax=Nostoc sp. TaxID=1180 RepID=UPI002FF4C218
MTYDGCSSLLTHLILRFCSNWWYIVTEMAIAFINIGVILEIVTNAIALFKQP